MLCVSGVGCVRVVRGACEWCGVPVSGVGCQVAAANSLVTELQTQLAHIREVADKHQQECTTEQKGRCLCPSPECLCPSPE